MNTSCGAASSQADQVVKPSNDPPVEAAKEGTGYADAGNVPVEEQASAPAPGTLPDAEAKASIDAAADEKTKDGGETEGSYLKNNLSKTILILESISPGCC